MTVTDTRQLQPTVAWPALVSAAEAKTLVNRRLKEKAELRATLYHHPFMGLIFRGRQASTGPFFHVNRPPEQHQLVQAHVLVDLVGGRAFLSDGWTVDELLAIDETSKPRTIDDPEPKVNEVVAIRSARALLASVVLRRRRFSVVDELELATAPLVIGKPNWWVTGVRDKQSIEVIVDGITGKHYAFSV